MGTAPTGVTGGRSSTRVKVETPVLLPDMSFGPYKGKGAAWGGTVEVPKIPFTLGSGIYKVNGTATGTGGWRCTGSAYVQLGDTSPIEAATGAQGPVGWCCGPFFPARPGYGWLRLPRTCGVPEARGAWM